MKNVNILIACAIVSGLICAPIAQAAYPNSYRGYIGNIQVARTVASAPYSSGSLGHGPYVTAQLFRDRELSQSQAICVVLFPDIFAENEDGMATRIMLDVARDAFSSGSPIIIVGSLENGAVRPMYVILEKQETPHGKLEEIRTIATQIRALLISIIRGIQGR